MSKVSNFLLDTCFWQPFDQRIPAEETDLMTGRHNGRPLIEILQTQFGLSLSEAQLEIEAARHEVEL